MTLANGSSDGSVQRHRQVALAWFVRRHRANWCDDDERALQAWLAEDPRHGDAYQRCSEQWSAFDGMPADLVVSMRRNLKRDKAVLNVPAAVLTRRHFLRPGIALGGIAAVGGAGWLAWQHIQAQPMLVQALSTERGQQKSVPLPDGTMLRLDTATSVVVAYYRNRREVTVQDGQVVFDVQPDGRRPFDVLAGPVKVTVVGTRFSVRHIPSMPGEEGVRVAVEHGRVRVARAGRFAEELRGPDESVLLGAGQQLGSDRNGVFGTVMPTSPEGIASWQDQRVVFMDVPLDQALAELERYQSTGLFVRDPAAAALRLTGTFDPMSPNTLRVALPRALPVRLQADGSRTEIVLRN